MTDTELDIDGLASLINLLAERVEYMEKYFKDNFDAGGPVITKLNKLEQYMEYLELEPKENESE